MGYLYRPKLKEASTPRTAIAERCKDPRHGHEDTCPRCGARFGKV